MPRFFRVNINGSYILCVVTSSGTEVSQWIANIKIVHRAELERLVVGLNLKCVIDFNHNTAAVLLLCVGGNCLIFQILHADFIPPELRDFLLEHATTFVGDRILGQITKLFQDYSLGVRRAVDVGICAGLQRRELGLLNVGLEQLSWVVLGFAPYWPSINMSDIREWDALYLTPEQITVASAEAALSYWIGCALEAWTCPGMFSAGV